MVRFWAALHDCVLTVCRTIFLWFVYVDYIIHGYLYKAIYLSDDDVEEKDELEKVFRSLGDKGKRIDQSYSSVFKELENEEEALRINRDNQDPEIFRSRVQAIRESKQKNNMYFKREYKKLAMERNFLIQKAMDENHLCDDSDDFEKVFLERKSNEQKHQTRIDNLAALSEDLGVSSYNKPSLLPPEPS